MGKSIKMKAYYQPNSKLGKLEAEIWETARKEVYGRRITQVEKLQDRLQSYFFTETPASRAFFRLGTDKLKNLKPNLEEVTEAIFAEYRKDVELGTGVVYDPRSHDFMPSEFRRKRTWLLRYAALLDIVHKDNSLAQKIVKFDARIHELLVAYNNLRTFEWDYTSLTHDRLSSQDRSYEALRNALTNIDANIERLGRLVTDDLIDTKLKELVSQLKDYIRRNSYRTKAAIMFDFYAKLNSSASRTAGGKVYKDREERRFVRIQSRKIAKRLRQLGLLDDLPPHAKAFYGV